MDCHLFSVYDQYARDAFRWLRDYTEGINDIESYVQKYKYAIPRMEEFDKQRRIKQQSSIYNEDWDSLELFRSIDKHLQPLSPKRVMLDSGAFSAWQSGKVTTLDQVIRKYSQMLEYKDKFVEYNVINLDVIPPKKAISEDEMQSIYDESDRNFEKLVSVFGNHVLPVFHQGEPIARLEQIVAQVDGKSNFICVSPNNALGEKSRRAWAQDVFGILNRRWPHIKGHGLATTGSKMMRDVPWYSVDSTLWILRGSMGAIMIVDEDNNMTDAGASLTNDAIDLDGIVNSNKGRVNGYDLGVTDDMDIYEQIEIYVKSGIKHENIPVIGNTWHSYKHLSKLQGKAKQQVEEQCEEMGVPLQALYWDYRLRYLYNVIRLNKFASDCGGHNNKVKRNTLFDAL